MLRFALLAALALAASAAPSQAACQPVVRARVATARVGRAVTAPVRFLRDRRPLLPRPGLLLMRWRLSS